MKTYNFEREECFDSRDVEERIEDLKADADLTEEKLIELKELEALKFECEGYGWERGINFISDTYFEDYAKDLFDDCYLSNLPEHLKNYIDYKAFADDIHIDYMTLTFRGTDFHYREV